MSNRRGVIAFLLITFGISWSSWFVERLVFGWSLVNPLAQLPGAFAPAIAAVVVRKWITREGFGDAAFTPKVRAAWRWYLVAWLGPLAVTAAGLAVAAGLGRWRPDLSPVGGLLLVLPILTIVLVPVYWGEEFGWTGYLRARLLPGRPLAAVLVTGLIWGVWHVPLAFLGYIEFSNHLVALPIWTAFFVLQQIPLSWLYLASKTVWVPSLAHAGNNMVIGLITEVLLVEHGDLDPVSVMFVLSVPLGIASLFMVRGRLLGRRASAAESVDAHQASTAARTGDVAVVVGSVTSSGAGHGHDH